MHRALTRLYLWSYCRKNRHCIVLIVIEEWYLVKDQNKSNFACFSYYYYLNMVNSRVALFPALAANFQSKWNAPQMYDKLEWKGYSWLNVKWNGVQFSNPSFMIEIFTLKPNQIDINILSIYYNILFMPPHSIKCFTIQCQCRASRWCSDEHCCLPARRFLSSMFASLQVLHMFTWIISIFHHYSKGGMEHCPLGLSVDSFPISMLSKHYWIYELKISWLGPLQDDPSIPSLCVLAHKECSVSPPPDTSHQLTAQLLSPPQVFKTCDHSSDDKNGKICY